MGANRFEKILPVGAPPKYLSVLATTSAFVVASVWLGKLPYWTNTFAACSGAVSHSARSLAAAAFLPPSGTRRYEPPQLLAPPGMTSATSQLVWSGALPVMICVIHGGQS